MQFSSNIHNYKLQMRIAYVTVMEDIYVKPIVQPPKPEKKEEEMTAEELAAKNILEHGAIVTKQNVRPQLPVEVYHQSFTRQQWCPGRVTSFYWGGFRFRCS